MRPGLSNRIAPGWGCVVEIMTVKGGFRVWIRKNRGNPRDAD
ncbi:hypothetical protein SpAn4DRAFT_1880 [Sporomusa ovata]|uniref:Uncharacterized protein n=1 Tax=Sporomusa ovata TaxID=2378 RepID=A0A0U1KTZ2_9FIRM|nr:hypothetical protein SpAn4DRAFT_1880 [Sporomusa ovata]